MWNFFDVPNDKDVRDGRLSLEEFITGVSEMHPVLQGLIAYSITQMEGIVTKIFETIDGDGNGKINYEELSEYSSKHLGENVSKDVYALINTDQDEGIEKAEMSAFLVTQHPLAKTLRKHFAQTA